MYLIEFQFFENLPYHEALHKMRTASNDECRWIEWTEEMKPVFERPDLTLIDVKHLGWAALAKCANAARGRSVALVGDCPATLGLPGLSRNFEIQDLLTIFHEARHPDEPQVSKVRLLELSRPHTIPMPLVLA